MVMLQNWVNQARQHWAEFQPTKYRELKKAGTLETALQDAAKRTADEMDQLENSGYREHEAWEMTREKYLFPPEEQSLKDQQDAEPQRSGAALSEVMGMPLYDEDEEADQHQA
ncbi:TPA: hypothetical protein ME607_001423 [Klebsiella pneumoniae]|uniref:hypothetical protein n=1 Tax=Klebsiella/Raoultella group TaxID=2890311 RepID=UPI0007CA0530|nr:MULTISPECIES: hypothetical protein [Klebsiella/Raoultella group]AUV00386.1 hypothetical protein C2U51_04815 [Enterobacteriaceae bacterium ENNIH1]HBW1666489.1 hypothetical protein [Klebsiella quasipneumoniae subsp. similipneumoniae]AUU95195.1 hypothetical protein C2U49_10475 [Klebsiella pneumoniae]AUV36588.1 hypothetical protein C2U50_07515 [Klebsiella pneumoniae]AUV40200.1 hypothetical protein C2U50_27550 [Klebsiella pneumoniae]